MPATGEAFPFIDHEKPLSAREVENLKFLFGDVGCLYFLIDNGGGVRWTMDCY